MMRCLSAHLCVDEWARVEELWDLEEAWLAGNDPSVAGCMTRSVGGTFFDMYCLKKNKKYVDENLKPKSNKHPFVGTSVDLYLGILRKVSLPAGFPLGQVLDDWVR